MGLNRATGVLSIFTLLAFASAGQTNRYMVFFKDKAGSSYSTTQPLQYLSQKAIERRIRNGVSVSPEDFPVNPDYVRSIKALGVNTFFTTRWMNGVLVQCDASRLEALRGLLFVDRVELVAPQAKLGNGGRRNIPLRKRTITAATQTQTQLQMIGLTDMQAAGFRGEGITIAVFDGGFQGVNSAAPFQDVISEGRFHAEVSYDFVSNGSDVFKYDDHGTEVFSVIAANIPDAFLGGAYKANFQLYVTEDVSSEYRIEEYNWLFAAERADSAGADIISSSLGYYDFDLASMNYTTAQMDGKTAVVTRAAQLASDRGIIVVCSAGNEGNIPAWRIIAAPADARDAIAVANVNEQGVRSSSSSIGPSSDGRIKPDLAALGTGVRVIKPSGVISSASGTSLSAPLITSLVAGVLQRYPDMISKDVVRILKTTASQGNNPDNQLGYGIPNFRAVVNYLDRIPQKEIFEVFPNPVTDTITISPIDPDSITACRVEFISYGGQLLFEAEAAFSWLNRFYKMDLLSYPVGAYFLRVWHNGHRYIFKIIKQ